MDSPGPSGHPKRVPIRHHLAAAALIPSMALFGCGRTVPDAEDAGSTDVADTTDDGLPEPDLPFDPTTTTTDDGTFIADETDDAEPPPPKTCRDILMCAFDCLLSGGLNTSCLTMCGEGADQAELIAAGQLVACVGQQCFQSGKCTLEDPTSMTCLGCLGLGLIAPEPTGCEAEAMACQ